MANKYALKEVHVTLQSGIVLVAEVEDLEALTKLLGDLRDKKLTSFPGAPTGKKNDSSIAPGSTPEARIELGAGLIEGALAKSGIIAFKDNVPELIDTTDLSVTDAVLLLLLGLEMGMKETKIDYEYFKSIYEAQNIKSGSPLSMKLTDLRTNSYVDKKLYNAEKCLRLTAKGQKKAIKTLKSRIK